MMINGLFTKYLVMTSLNLIALIFWISNEINHFQSNMVGFIASFCETIGKIVLLVFCLLVQITSVIGIDIIKIEVHKKADLVLTKSPFSFQRGVLQHHRMSLTF